MRTVRSYRTAPWRVDGPTGQCCRENCMTMRKNLLTDRCSCMHFGHRLPPFLHIYTKMLTVLRSIFSSEKTSLEIVDIQPLTRRVKTVFQFRINRCPISHILNGDSCEIDIPFMLNRETTACGVDFYAVSFSCYSSIPIGHEAFPCLAILKNLAIDS